MTGMAKPEAPYSAMVQTWLRDSKRVCSAAAEPIGNASFGSSKSGAFLLTTSARLLYGVSAGPGEIGQPPTEKPRYHLVKAWP